MRNRALRLAAGGIALAFFLSAPVHIFAEPAAEGDPKSAERNFRLKREKGIWWLLDPSGEKFFSSGVNAVNMGISLKRYDPAIREYCALRFHGSEEAWRKAAGERLAEWNFNSLGEGSDEGLRGRFPYVVNLRLGTSVGAPWKDPASPQAKNRYAKLLEPLAGLRNDVNLIGYLLDGMAGWWDEGLFLHILKEDSAEEAMKLELMQRLRSDYGRDVSQFNEDFEVVPEPKKMDDLKGRLRRATFRSGRRPLIVEEFIGWVAERYYRALTEEVRKLDPDHLIFSDCQTLYYSQPVIRAAGKHVDAICVHCDSFAPQGWASPAYFETIQRLTGKPVLVGEFYFAAEENSSGNPNENGVYMTVRTQAERAKGAAALANLLARFPGVVGYHWYQYYDQAPGARAKQNFNLGLVDVKDEAYVKLGKALAEENAKSAERHGTWPIGIGMQRSSQGWGVKEMPASPKADGVLDEWDLAKAWVPAARGAAPFKRFADFYLSWHPEGVVFAVVYADYRYTRAQAAAPADDTERLTIGLAVEDEEPLGFTVQGIQVARDLDALDKGFHSPQVLAARGAIPFPAEGRFSIGQKAYGVQRIVEVFLPAALFKRGALEPGLKMRATASLRLRADFKETFWPVSFRRTHFAAARRWAPLVLEK